MLDRGLGQIDRALYAFGSLCNPTHVLLVYDFLFILSYRYGVIVILVVELANLGWCLFARVRSRVLLCHSGVHDGGHPLAIVISVIAEVIPDSAGLKGFPVVVVSCLLDVCFTVEGRHVDISDHLGIRPPCIHLLLSLHGLLFLLTLSESRQVA